MISLEKKFVFIHINKTAGTSIKQALQTIADDIAPWEYDGAKGYFGEPTSLPAGAIPQEDIEFKHTPHWVYDEYKRYLGDSFNDFFKFSVARNPWDRVVSFYLMKMAAHPALKLSNRIRLHLRPYLPDACPTFKEWASNCFQEDNSKNLNRFLRPCTHWLGEEMDFVAKFENLHEDFEKICKHLNVECKLEHYNKASDIRTRKERKPYREYYDDKTREIIRTRFIEDIETFNYTF